MEKEFAQIGARVKVREGRALSFNVLTDKKGEYFEVCSGTRDEQIEVVSVDAKLRHLLLLVRDGRDKSKFLCGHDERHWFVAGVDGAASNVKTAMEQLKPVEVRAQELVKRVKTKDKHKRHTSAYKRQGEWFFVPVEGVVVGQILKNEPIRRGRGKPHYCEELIRRGGVQVYVPSVMVPSDKLPPNARDVGLTEDEFREFALATGDKYAKMFTTMQRGADVYVRGRITHPDHATIVLQDWHKVIMNRETNSRAMAFLD